jgi:hypothetical protein
LLQNLQSFPHRSLYPRNRDPRSSLGERLHCLCPRAHTHTVSDTPWLTPPSSLGEVILTPLCVTLVSQPGRICRKCYVSLTHRLSLRVQSSLIYIPCWRERYGAPPPYDSRIWSHERPTAVVSRSTDWCSSDSRFIRRQLRMAMETPLGGASGPYFPEAVRAHRAVLLTRRLPPSFRSPASPCTARRNKTTAYPC